MTETKGLGIHKHLWVPEGTACLTSKVLREIPEGCEGGQTRRSLNTPPGLGEPHTAPGHEQPGRGMQVGLRFPWRLGSDLTPALDQPEESLRRSW